MGTMVSNEERDRIQKRVNKILESRFDTEKDTVDSLKDISSFFTSNTLQNRRNLRSQIEKKSVGINLSFLSAFREVKLTLNEVCKDLDSVAESVDIMKRNFESSKALTEDLITQSNVLEGERKKLHVHQQIAEAFLTRFQLSVPEHQLLYGTNTKTASIGLEFFLALDRVQSIQSDCHVLMQCGYQTVALDIIQEMSLHQEGALERLYRWTQNQCRTLESNEISSLVIEAMSRLQDRPVLFKHVIDEYAIARRSILVRNFIEALTKVGGPPNTLKPIELPTDDSKRYIGDMFAWLHHAIPNEKENLTILFSKCNQSDPTDQIESALVYIADGICHPLKVRVETILNAEKDTSVLYAISILLRFYHQIIKKVVQGGDVEKCLTNLQTFSEEVYLNALSMQVQSILQRYSSSNLSLELPNRDLVPPATVGQLLNMLKEILSVASMVDGRQDDTKKILLITIDPLLQSVQESASHLPTIDMAVYLLNCLYHMQSTLAVFEYMDERVERLQAQCEAQIDTLISEQASSLVANLNLGPIYTILQNNETKIEANLLKIFMSKMNEFLDISDMFLLPQIQLILSNNHRQIVKKRSFNVIVAIYKQIYERVHDPANNFENPEGFFSKTPDQVSKILSQ